MRGFCGWVILVIVCGALGCGSGERKPIEIPPPTSLTLEEWKTLPVEEKYAPETFERLKLNDPAIRSDKGWDAFFKTVIMPQRLKDLPPGQLPK